jgi:tetratricopeptide (TPR) repeat protein
VLRVTRWRFEEAEELLRKALAIRERCFGSGSDEVARTLRILSHALARQGAHDEAVACARRALEIVQALFPGDHPEVATSHETLGAALAWSHRFSDAEPELRLAMEMNERLLGIEHTQTIHSMLTVAQFLMLGGRRAETVELTNRSLDAISRRFGPESVPMAMALRALADYGTFPERTLELYEQALAAMRLATNGSPEATVALKASVEQEAAMPAAGEEGRDRAIEIGRELERDFATLGERAEDGPRAERFQHIVVFATALAERSWARRDADRIESAALVAEADAVLSAVADATIEMPDGSRGWQRPLHGARAAVTIARAGATVRGEQTHGATNSAAMVRDLDAAAAQLDLAASDDTVGAAASSAVAFFGQRSVARWRERLEEARRGLDR